MILDDVIELFLVRAELVQQRHKLAELFFFADIGNHPHPLTAAKNLYPAGVLLRIKLVLQFITLFVKKCHVNITTLFSSCQELKVKKFQLLPYAQKVRINLSVKYKTWL